MLIASSDSTARPTSWAESKKESAFSDDFNIVLSSMIYDETPKTS